LLHLPTIRYASFLKGERHKINIFVNVLQKQIGTFCMSNDDFHNFGCLFVEKLKVTFLLASLKAFTNFENPLRKACSGFQVGTYGVHWRKWINDRDAKPKR
jgi:hypothetical protein